MVRLETDRLILREWSKKDIKDLIENINDINIAINLVKVPYPYTKKDAINWIINCKKDQIKKPRLTYELAIELKSEGKVIGGIALININKFQGTSEVGCWIGEIYWRKKLATESLHEMLAFAFLTLKLKKVNAYIIAENLPSKRLVKKLGFIYEGTRKEYVRDKAKGDIHDQNIYRMLNKEWSKK